MKFNTGESGEVDLRDVIWRYEIAAPLRDPVRFPQFYLDSWPTIAWDYGFDVAPESLYSRVTGKETSQDEDIKNMGISAIITGIPTSVPG
uniref:DUF2442 domain-containing protein n=1 Tax=Candidatus Kentrum sp. LFY TaxID=2126342 RepID=A0A450URQ7_9GAMM|nr:MAG: Protein of unknown function (DUF2442) [Candidatus Kentron sp. LFY]